MPLARDVQSPGTATWVNQVNIFFEVYEFIRLKKLSLLCNSGPIPLRVREAEIPIVSDSECIRKINAVTEKIFILPASSFCAGGISGNDACQGDGGGPLGTYSSSCSMAMF